MWIDMNEPSNFGTDQNGTDYLHLQCFQNKLETPPYKTWAVYGYEDWEDNVLVGPVGLFEP